MIRHPRWRLIAVVICFASGLGIGTAKADVQVNTYTTGSQGGPSVAMEADGDFVVVWSGWGSADTDTSGLSIQGQRYASDGSTVGGQFQINTYTTDEQRFPLVAMKADGDFVVVWGSNGSYGTDSSFYSIQGQRYASDGSTLGGEFQINTITSLFQTRPSVALDMDGNFVVVWNGSYSYGTDSSFGSIQGQRYASDGSPLGGEFQVNTYTTDPQVLPSVAMEPDGDFIVVWESEGSHHTDSSVRSIQGQRYASDGSTLGGEFQINTYTTDEQRFPWVALGADGDFVVVWESRGSSGSDAYFRSIQGQRYASGGSTLGGEFQINTYTTKDQTSASVVLDVEGNFVVVWDSNGSGGTDSSYTSIQMGMELVFTDGFESGDTAGWSSVVGDL